MGAGCTPTCGFWVRAKRLFGFAGLAESGLLLKSAQFSIFGGGWLCRSSGLGRTLLRSSLTAYFLVWRGGVRCSETPWGQGRPNTTYPMGRLRVLHGLRCRWVGTVAVVVGGRGSRWGGGLSGRGKGYPCEGVGCGKGGWGECCWSRTLVGCRRVHAVNFPEVWISKVGTVTVVCKILQGLRRDNIWDHTVWEVPISSPRSGYPKWARLLSSVKFCKGFAGRISGTTPCGRFGFIDLSCAFRCPVPWAIRSEGTGR